MNKLLFSITVLLLSLTMGCKKDVDLMPIEEVDTQPFFARGSFYDTEDPTVREFDWDMRADEDDYFVYGVASSTGATETHKYAVGVMSYDLSSWQYDAPFDNTPDPNVPLDITDPFDYKYGATIGVKFISDRPAVEYAEPFSEAELLDLIRPGQYILGPGPGQVELTAIRPTGELVMLSPKPQLEHSFNSFEVLSVTDYLYEQQEGVEPTRGKVVHVRGQVAVEYLMQDRIYYLEVEGKFLFQHD